MDCNSIIYDAVRQIEMESNKSNMENRIIDAVIIKIQQHVTTIAPTNVLYIAFDGVAPFAKMEQQRTRRYKNSFLASLDFDENTRVSSDELKLKTNQKWNTAAITPGTHFMSMLSTRVKYAFSDPTMLAKCRIKTIVVSCSDEPGEGEHKMFQYLREHTNKHEIVAVYGLDSDLIMLSVLHCFYCRNIYIFRESPAFNKQVIPTLMRAKPDEPLFLNTYKLSKHIVDEMGCKMFSHGRIYDYVFMCFLLGNDFLPHFSALNLRTNGIYVLLNMYASYIGAYANRGFINENTKQIQWRWVHLFISECAKVEHQQMLEEYKNRNKLEKTTFPMKTAEERTLAFDNLPILMRGEEHYICPEEVGWEDRYYSVALHTERTPENVQRVCLNMLEGLEWVFKYYTEGCPHWRWKYDFHYAPLLVDLTKYIPLHDTTFIKSDLGKNIPFQPLVQLAYVIPKFQHPLLPEYVQVLLKKYDELFPDLEQLKFQWIGCRYFWEAHVILPKVPLSILEKWELEFAK
jgi:5'-3' exonuclease